MEDAWDSPSAMQVGMNWRARQESNLYQELRKLTFYPLNYRRQANNCSLFLR